MVVRLAVRVPAADARSSRMLPHRAAVVPAACCWSVSCPKEQPLLGGAGCAVGTSWGTSVAAQSGNAVPAAPSRLQPTQMDDLVATFSTLARVEELRSARAAGQQGAAEAAATAHAATVPPADPVHELFGRLDADGDGR